MRNIYLLSVSELNCPLKRHVRAVCAATPGSAVHDGGVAVHCIPTTELYCPENAKSLTGGTASGCALARKLSTVLLTLLRTGKVGSGAVISKETCRVRMSHRAVPQARGASRSSRPRWRPTIAFPAEQAAPGPERRQRTPREARTQTALQDDARANITILPFPVGAAFATRPRSLLHNSAEGAVTGSHSVTFLCSSP